MTFDELIQRIAQATDPADLFGNEACTDAAALRRCYLRLAATLHPDRHPDRIAEATAAFQRLQHWRNEAHRRLQMSSAALHVTTRQHVYRCDELPLSGDLCDLFPSTAGSERVVLKIVRNARNNDLLQAEADALRTFDRELNGQAVRAHFPSLLEDALLTDMAGTQRWTNILRFASGAVTLDAVMRAYPQGLHPADAAWMFNRLLATLAIAHGLGLVHGAVIPPHVAIFPEDHNGMLFDWCYSVAPGELLKAVSPPYRALYPPEVLERRPVSPATDLFMAARCMALLLGSDASASRFPEVVPRSLQRLLRVCLIPAPHRRPSDAWAVFDDLQTLLRAHYGPPQFRPFVMPASR
ncbi:MAG: hypothetical protein RMJ55_08290 [Roseiflexaceae bacterium]|nr:hypothetical protein [Roseiflexus sp.]MDW8213541.1 hypothetical protein [Roseiflexaceae bacterium]